MDGRLQEGLTGESDFMSSKYNGYYYRPPVLVSDQNGILQVPGSEWAAFKLGLPGAVRAVEIDTNHFKVVW